MNTTTADKPASTLAQLAARITRLEEIRGQLAALSREVIDAGARTAWVRLIEGQSELLAEIDTVRNQLEQQRADHPDDQAQS